MKKPSPTRASRWRPAAIAAAAVTAVAAVAVAVPRAASAAPASPAAAAAARAEAVIAAAQARSVPAVAGALPTTPSSLPVGTGPVPNARFLNFPVSDKVSLQVNVGSGNALLTTSDLGIQEAGSGTLPLGAAYNSLLNGAGVTGADGYGWRQRQGADVRLYTDASGNVTLLGPDGTSGKFTLSSGSYTSPAIYHSTLVASPPTGKCSGSAYGLIWHATSQIMCFNSNGLLTTQSDRNGNTTAFSYDGSGNETTVTYTPAGASAATETVAATYTSGNLTSLTQSGGTTGAKTVTYTINGAGDLASVQEPDGTTVSFGYDSSHNLTSVQNAAGVTTILGYNSSRQVTSVAQTYGSASATATTRLSYVSATETQVALPDTNQSQPVSSVPNTTYTLNSQDLATTVVDPAGDTVNTHYDAPTNNVTSLQNALTGTTSYTYGSNNSESLTETDSAMGAKATSVFGNIGNTAYLPSSSKDAQANQTLYTYDGAGNPAQTTNAMAAAAKVTYNSSGNGQGQAATSTDPTGSATAAGQTSYSYNSLHQLITVTPPTTGSLLAVHLTYDGFGRVATETGGGGKTVTYTYDLADRVTQEAYTGGAATLTVTYTYDGAGNLHTQASTAGSVTTTWTYDGRNSVLTKNATSGGGTLTYDYNSDGDMTSEVNGAGTTNYVYNDLNQMTSLTDPDSIVWTFTYNQQGQRTRTYFDGTGMTNYAVKEAVGYDKSGRINVLQANYNSGAGYLENNSYCYSPYVTGSSCPASSATSDTEQLQYSTNALTGVVTKFTYDAGDRLKTATNYDGANYSYTYDNNGNVTAGTGSGALSYNVANEITGSSWGQDHDGNVNLDPANGSLTYNDAGQLTGASSPGGGGASPSTFTYAGADQAEPLSDGSATAISYGGSDSQYGEPVVDSYTTGGAVNYIIRDQQGTPLGMIRSGHSYVYLTDTSGSVTMIADTTGTGVGGYAYDPYGNVTSVNNAPGATIAAQNRISYTGAFTDDTFNAATGTGSIGYVSDGARWYNTENGRFTTQDTDSYLASPANGNRYAYAADNPVSNTDPTGNGIFTLLPVLGTLISGTVRVLAGNAESALGGRTCTTDSVGGAILGGAVLYGGVTQPLPTTVAGAAFITGVGDNVICRIAG